MKITVVAMGKIGLPLAVQFASKGFQVIGTDVNKDAIDKINNGVAPFPGEFDLEPKLAAVVNEKLLQGSLDTSEAVSVSDVVVVVVPLFVDSEGVPDFKWMDNATVDIAKGLKSGTLVSYETTLPVGTTRNRFAKLLEQHSGLRAGIDFHLAFSPERVRTGRIFEDLRKYPKLVGGINAASGEAAKKFYELVLDFDARPDLDKENGVWDLGSSEASEFSKLAETTYRDVNIGLANQFAKFAQLENIDIYKVIEACNSQPYSHIHTPGIAVGGHCIPIYPQMYLWNDPEATIVRAARQNNSQMPAYYVGIAEGACGDLKEKKVLILGVSYRGAVKEHAFSGSWALKEILESKGAYVTALDPMYTDEEINSLGFNPHELGHEVDIAILQADHKEFLDYSEKDFPNLQLVLDGRNFLNSDSFKKLK